MHGCIWGRAGLSLALLFWVSFGASALGAEALDTVKSAAEKALQVLKDPTLKTSDKKKERIARLKEIINPIFDYEEMARRSLGPYWRRLTPAEQEEFAKLFREFLEKTYADKVDLYDGEKILFKRETTELDYAQVDSSVINDKGEARSVVYRLKRTDGQWKVYDAVIENVRIVNNYRSQFERVIAKSSYEDLKKMLREKVQ
jgi:phospholipid transport system substrate-binding protein